MNQKVGNMWIPAPPATICAGCSQLVDDWAAHTETWCNYIKFKRFEAQKFDMVSIYDHLTTKYHYNYVVGNLKNIYPRIASKVFQNRNNSWDIFVESWAAEAIKLYITSDGFAGMNLADFLDKTATDRHATKTASI